MDVARAREANGRPEVLLVFEAEQSNRPVIVGLIAPPPGQPSELEALLDGRRVVLEAKDEIVLKCGKARLVLRSNGRVVSQGTYIETDSEGINRIKGGTIQID